VGVAVVDDAEVVVREELVDNGIGRGKQLPRFKRLDAGGAAARAGPT